MARERAIRSAAYGVQESADAVENAANWASWLIKQVAQHGIDLSIKRREDGHFAVHVCIPIPVTPSQESSNANE